MPSLPPPRSTLISISSDVPGSSVNPGARSVAIVGEPNPLSPSGDPSVTRIVSVLLTVAAPQGVAALAAVFVRISPVAAR